MPDAAAFFDSDLRGDTFLETFNVADDANHLAAGVQSVECIERNHLQRIGVKCPKAFVEKERVDGSFMADQVGERERQGETDEETLAAGERARVAGNVSGVVSHLLTYMNETDQLLGINQADHRCVTQPLPDYGCFILQYGSSESIHICGLTILAYNRAIIGRVCCRFPLSVPEAAQSAVRRGKIHATAPTIGAESPQGQT